MFQKLNCACVLRAHINPSSLRFLETASDGENKFNSLRSSSHSCDFAAAACKWIAHVMGRRQIGARTGPSLGQGTDGQSEDLCAGTCGFVAVLALCSPLAVYEFCSVCVQHNILADYFVRVLL